MGNITSNSTKVNYRYLTDGNFFIYAFKGSLYSLP